MQNLYFLFKLLLISSVVYNLCNNISLDDLLSSKQVIIFFASAYAVKDSSEINLMLKDQVIELLNYNFIIHFVMLYLILMLIFISILKYIIDNNIFIEKVKFVPYSFGGFASKYIYVLLNKVINIWSKSYNFWFFFISISLFILMSVSTFGLYACLFLLN